MTQEKHAQAAMALIKWFKRRKIGMEDACIIMAAVSTFIIKTVASSHDDAKEGIAAYNREMLRHLEYLS